MRRLALLLVLVGCGTPPTPTWEGRWGDLAGYFQWTFDPDHSRYEWLRTNGPQQRETGTFTEDPGRLLLIPNETSCPPLTPTTIEWDRQYVDPHARRFVWPGHAGREVFPGLPPLSVTDPGCSSAP